jgi:uncharacterized membrane protein YphA (DoxX/SURF4 family)
MIRRLVGHVLALGLAALFGYAGAAKLRAPRAFAEEIANYQLLPALAPHLAIVLPVLELLVACALLPPRSRRPAALVASALMAAFLVAVTSVVVRHVDISCGCFGKDSAAVTWLTVARNVALLAACGYLVFDVGGAGSSSAGGASSEAGGEAGVGRPG